MTNEQYLRELARALTRREDLTAAQAKDKLYELALRIYALLITRLPPTRFERELRWPALRAEALRVIEPVAQELYALLTEGVIAAESEAIRLALKLYGLPPGALAPRPTAQLLLETRVLAQPLSVLGAPSIATGASPLGLQLVRLLEHSVYPKFFTDTPTHVIAAKVAETRTRSGQTYAVATRGTVANAWRERIRGITAATIWAPVAVAAERAGSAAVTLGVTPAAQPPLWRWNAVLDPRTCPVCRPLDGTTAPSPQAFPLGPPPLHPLCVLGDAKVTTGSVIAATRAIYSGNVVTIRTKSGRTATVTAQHPMLTTRGWLRANELVNGDDLLSHSLGAPASLDLPNLDNAPTIAEEVFESLRATSEMTTTCVPPAPMQFHGDGASFEGHVDVVHPSWQLQETGLIKFEQLSFKFNRIGRDAQLTLEPGLSDLDFAFLATNAAANGLVSLSHQALSLLRPGVSHSDKHRLATIARSHPLLTEPSFNDISRAPERFRQLLDALPGFMAPDQIVSIQIIPIHKTPVYDFTTTSSIYSIDGLLSHNCRCVVIPVRQ